MGMGMGQSSGWHEATIDGSRSRALQVQRNQMTGRGRHRLSTIKQDCYMRCSHSQLARPVTVVVSTVVR